MIDDSWSDDTLTVVSGGRAYTFAANTVTRAAEALHGVVRTDVLCGSTPLPETPQRGAQPAEQASDEASPTRGPAYLSENAKLPEVESDQLDTLDVGLYRVRGQFRYGDLYDPTTDELHQDVPSVMLARVDDGPTELPIGVLRAEIRADGKRLVVAWVRA